MAVYWRRDLSLYPNPAVDEVTLDLPDQKKGYLRVLDMEGGLMEERETFGFSSSEQIDVRGYATGTYVVEYVPGANPKRTVWTGNIVVVE